VKRNDECGMMNDERKAGVRIQNPESRMDKAAEPLLVFILTF
jgi:hypothetical protein